MAKKIKNPRVPRTMAENTLTTSEFFSGIRSYLRRLWLFKSENRKAVLKKQYSATLKKYQCEMCNKMFYKKDVEVDHINPIGSLKTFSDIEIFYERLFCDINNLRVLCKETCHRQVTAAERNKKS